MALAFKLLGSSGIASASNTTVYTVPASTQTEVKSLWITNVTGTDETIEIWHVESGDSAVDSNKRIFDLTIPANDFKKIQADWQLATGDTIQAKGSTNNSITIGVYGAEEA